MTYKNNSLLGLDDDVNIDSQHQFQERKFLTKVPEFIKTKQNYILQIPTTAEYAYHTSKQASPSTINLETHPSHKLYSHPGYSLSASSPTPQILVKLCLSLVKLQGVNAEEGKISYLAVDQYRARRLSFLVFLVS
ncbi:Quinic acid utilization activator [Fusarium oxysporum f. sp. albedinis]|nr:Quinic acid utilization activator [Fusarium oxysporum f. sp. albedinis]